jgi:flagellar hook-associated protein 1
MGNLLSSLLNSANAFSVFDRQIAVVQSNVTNASTPGYVRQTQTIESLPFDQGVSGGIRPGPVESARSEYAEESVRRQQSLLGQAGQKAGDLAQIESLFDLSSSSGVPNALAQFFQSFSKLSINPNDSIARQSVIDSAGNLTQAANQTGIGLASAGTAAGKQTGDTLETINRLASEIRDLNQTVRQDSGSQSDAGLDAKLHATLEELSQYANFSALRQADGTTTVYLGGQTPLVIGEHQYSIQGDFSTGSTKILDANGADITSQVTSGKLAGLLEERNQLLPSYLADLNTFAHSLSDQVNAKLQAGVDSSGTTPAVDLFSYNSTVGEAISLSVTDITPDQIAAAYPSAPGGNGNALDLAGMQDTPALNGFTFTQYFGNIGGRVGRDISTAKDQQQTQTSTLTQAKNLRDQVSSVSLDEEAAHLIQLQRAYQAAGKMMSVLNELTGTVIDIIK